MDYGNLTYIILLVTDESQGLTYSNNALESRLSKFPKTCGAFSERSFSK